MYQNIGHGSFRAAPEPCDNQADRYGVRTAKGTDRGLNGFASYLTAAKALEESTHARKSNGRNGMPRLRRAVRSRCAGESKVWVL